MEVSQFPFRTPTGLSMYSADNNGVVIVWNSIAEKTGKEWKMALEIEKQERRRERER